jgi:DNA-binding GntR family transcriptional regulator
MTESDVVPALPTVRAPTSLRDEAIKTLEAAIIAGELRPGVVYSAPTVAAQLGMSATPVREAVLDLVKEGLLTTVRNKGFRVVELDDAELDELTEVRLLIEVPAIAGLAERGLTPTERAHLDDLAAELERTARSRDLTAHNRADLDFHTELLALTGNRTLVDLVRRLRIRSRLYGQSALAATGDLTPTAQEHAELLDRLALGDGAGAAALMRTHIGHVRGSWATGRGD